MNHNILVQGLPSGIGPKSKTSAISIEIGRFPVLLCQSKSSSACQAYDYIIKFIDFCTAQNFSIR